MLDEQTKIISVCFPYREIFQIFGTVIKLECNVVCFFLFFKSDLNPVSTDKTNTFQDASIQLTKTVPLQ